MELLELSLEIATCAQRDRFAERPVEEIRESCKKLTGLADSIIQDIGDPLVLQPASLDLATLKKKAGDDLGFFIVPSFHGVHQIGDIKFKSPANQCGKIEEGDEVVQVNYQTVVGWQTKKVMFLLEESPTDIFLTLKKRPRHTKVYGQIYMKPYRLPSKKRAAPYTRWHDNLPSPRPELLTIPDFEMPLPRASPKQRPPQPTVMPLLVDEPLVGTSSSDDDDDETFLPGAADLGQASPTSMRLYLPKQRSSVQRRATVTGASPTSRRPPVNIEQLWRELRLERQWRGGDSGGSGDGDLCQLRDKSASVGNGLASSVPRPSTCLGIERTARPAKKTLRINAGLEEVSGTLPSESEDASKIEENRISPSGTSKDINMSTKPVNGDSEDKNSVNGTDVEVFQGNKQEVKPPLTPREEMKIVLTSDEGRVFPIKERGRLDKSYSTPAYDLSDCEQNDIVEHTQTKFISTNSTVICSDSGSEMSAGSALSHSTQIKEMQVQSENVKANSSDSGSERIDPHNAEIETDLVEDVETQRIGQILEAINIDLLQHRLREQENMERRKNRNLSDDNTSKVTTENVQLVDCVNLNSDIITDSAQGMSVEETQNSLHLSNNTHELSTGIKSNMCVDEPLKQRQSSWNPPADTPSNARQPVMQQNILPEDASSEEVEPTPQPVAKASAIPPEPPPRPDQQRSNTSMAYRAKLVARSLGPTNSARTSVAAMTAPSPRTVRKRNALLAKRRNVSARELGAGECEGWLLHRCRCSGAGATWLRAWFVLKGTAFYGFKSPQSARADVMISLPGFTASVAEEVKSKKFAFKVYHTGTVFYFAAETEEERTTWLDCITVVTVMQELGKPNNSDIGVCFSETDEDSEIEAETETETCFPSPKMRKFASLLGSNGPSNASRSHQNLASETKTTDIQKKFGSLKKLGRKVTESNSNTNSPAHADLPAASAASLDRKYLRFLGGGRNNMVPVPTAHFRSYRRVPTSPQSKMPTELYGQRILERAGRIGSNCQEQPSGSKTLTRDVRSPEASSASRSQFYLSAESVLVQERIQDVETKPHVTPLKERSAVFPVEKPKPQDRLVRTVKMGDFRDRQIHASNPSLQLPADMADYRMAAERLREFGIRRNRQREDTSGFVTLEEFMLSRQEEERRSATAMVRSQNQGNNDVHHTVDSRTSSDGSSSSSATRGGRTRGSAAPSLTRRGSFNSTRTRRPNNGSELAQDMRNREYRGGSPEKLWIDSLRRNDDIPKRPAVQASQRSAEGNGHNGWGSGHLKSAAQYQPPPVSQTDESSRMKLAFEMHLGEKDTANSKTSKFRNLFTSSKPHQHHLEVPTPTTPSHHQKTLLGSPRLHRAIFREKRHASSKGSTSESSSSSVTSPISPPFVTGPNEWAAEGFTDPNAAHIKPTMGISMLGKKPSRRLPPTAPVPLPSPTSPPPDYPGLEYPPVFEPETYTLSDASSLMRSRQSRSHSNK